MTTTNVGGFWTRLKRWLERPVSPRGFSLFVCTVISLPVLALAWESTGNGIYTTLAGLAALAGCLILLGWMKKRGDLTW